MDEHRQELAAWAKAVNGVLEAAESFGSCTRDEILFLAKVWHEQDAMLQPGKVFRARVGAVRPCPSGVDIGLDSGGGETDFSLVLVCALNSLWGYVFFFKQKPAYEVLP